MQLEITNVIDISVSEEQSGLGEYNTSNLAIFSNETPADSFGTDGYANYLSPTQIGIDFGTDSETYAMANAIFSQSPNILAGGGELTVILLITAIQNLAFSGTAASGTFVMNYGGNATAAINWNDTAAQIQTKLQVVPGLEQALVSGSVASHSLHVTFAGAYGVQALITITSDTLATSGITPVTITVTTLTAGETLGAAITRTAGLVQYFGVITNSNLTEIGQTDMLAAATVIQALNKIAFFVSYDSAAIESGGILDLLTTGSLTQSRGLYYGDDDGDNAILMMAAYAGRALSTNFDGSNTTQNMNLKDLAGVQPDPTMTQTLQNKAKAAGADTYVSIQGVAKILCSGANKFFDQVYNLRWFVGALQIAGFNYLAESSTKIPQTENGIDGLKGAYRNVCEQGVTNQYGAPGRWTSSTTFGNQADLVANVAQRGYYIYSQPISQQSQASRADRAAPLVQIAFKEAGAVDSSAVIVNVNA